jgi:hypothetical protein
LERAQLERPLDLAKNFEAMEKNRATLVKFVAGKMAESAYKPDKYPVSGQMHDFYRLPGFDKKVLTKQGSEKLAQLFGLRRARTESVDRACTKEFSMAVVRVTLVDRFGYPAGSGEAACTTAETGIQRSAKKYDNDFRAALNDVVAKAGKRAFTQAVVYATATDEMFDVTGTPEKAVEATGTEEEKKPAPRFPEKFGSVGGKLVSEVSIPELVKVADWCRTKAKNPKAVQPMLEAIEEELDRRRDGEDEPPV